MPWCSRKQLRRRKAGWGAAEEGRVVPNESELDTACATGELRAKGEACRESGEPVTVQGLPNTGDRSLWVWVERERPEGNM